MRASDTQKSPYGGGEDNGWQRHGSLKKYRQSRGLCEICGAFQTHEMEGKRKFMRKNKYNVPLTTQNSDGSYSVYKGFCIQPKCYTLTEAKKILGEPTPEPTPEPFKKRKKVPPCPPKDRSSDSLSQNSNCQRLNVSGHHSMPNIATLEDHSNGDGIHVETPPRNTRPNNEPSLLDQKKALSDRQRTRKPFAERQPPAPDVPLPSESSEATSSRSGYSDHSSQSHQEKAKAEYTVPEIQSQSNCSDQKITHPTTDTRVVTDDKSVPDHTESPARIDYSDEAHAVATDKLDDAARVNDFTLFLTILESNATKSNVVIYGLSLLRTIVNRAHKLHATTFVFISDTWVKSLKCIMSDNKANPVIQEEGSFTLWVLSAISDRYLLDIVKYGGVKHMVSLLKSHPGHFGIGEKCCGTLEIFTARESSGLILPNDDVEAIIQALTNTVACPDAGGRDSALRALLNLAQSRQPRIGIPIEELIRDAIPDSRGIHAIIEASCDPLFAEQAIWLLWTMSAPVGKPCVVPLSTEIISAITVAVTNNREASLQEAAHGLLANLVSQRGFPLALVPKVTECAIASLWEPVEVQDMGWLRVLCNILYDSDRREVLDLDGIISCVTNVMESNSHSLEAQAMGCLALAYMSSKSEEVKVSISTKGGINSIANAFRSSADNTLDSPENTLLKLELRSNASTALMSLALSPIVMEDMERSGILAEVAETLRGSDISSLPLIVQEGVMNLVHSSLKDDERMTSTVALDVVMDIDAGEEEIESSIKRLFALSVKSPSTLNSVMAARNGNGAARISELIENFVSSEGIRSSACGLLAGIYAHVPFQGHLDQTSSIEVGSAACIVTTHSGTEVEAFRDCLRVQKTEEDVLGNATIALSNFLCGLSPMHEGILSDEIRALFSGALNEIVDVMACHEDDMELQTNCIRCVRVVLFAVDYTELIRGGVLVVSKIVLAMNEFPKCYELQLNACIALMALLDGIDEDDSISILGEADGINAILACFGNANEELVNFATELLAVTVGRLLTAVSVIVEGQESFECIITCMYRHQSSIRIQAHCCFILWSLATLHDSYVLPMIVESGGVTAILEAMNVNESDEMIQEYGCKALSAVAAGLPRKSFSELQQALAENTLRVLNARVQVAQIATPALEMVARLCGQDPLFKNFFSRSNCIPLVIEAMKQHLSDQFVQLGGISVLWSLAGFGDNKHTIGQHGGLQAIINALLAHIDVKQIQTDGMTVLKNLATTAMNKQIIVREGGEKAIVCSVWVNMDSDHVLVAAFAALNNIAVDRESRRVSTVSNDTLTCILLGMRRFRQSEAVQENACFLLKSYTYSPINVTRMRHQSREFCQELVMAAKSFPSTCGERAHYVLSKCGLL